MEFKNTLPAERKLVDNTSDNVINRLNNNKIYKE